MKKALPFRAIGLGLFKNELMEDETTGKSLK
jgi:hypothetical protein